MTSVLLLTLAASVTAEPAPRVKVEVNPKNGGWVGQRVTLAITLATPDLFAGVPSFGIPQIPGVIVVPPTGSPTLGSEKVGDVTFTTQRHEFAVFPQRDGAVRIPAFPIRFESNAGFGKPTIKREVTTQAVSFPARTPPGAEGLGTVIAARDLKITDKWDPDAKSLKVGDAITRTITIAAADIPGMVFPPIHFDTIDGLAAYPKDPVVNDHTDRGTITGQRTDAVTFVCERPDTVSIPDRTFTWFDLDANKLRTEKLPGRTFDVQPNPSVVTDQQSLPGAANNSQHRRWWWLLPVVGIVALVAGLTAMRIWPLIQHYRAKTAESESAYFSHYRRACHRGDPQAIYSTLLTWLERLGPISLDEFVISANDPLLAKMISDLGNHLYSGSSSGNWNSKSNVLFNHTARARDRVVKQSRIGKRNSHLPTLNPS